MKAACIKLERSWINAISKMYSEVNELFGGVIVKLKTSRVFDFLAPCHYILNPHRTV